MNLVSEKPNSYHSRSISQTISGGQKNKIRVERNEMALNKIQKIEKIGF